MSPPFNRLAGLCTTRNRFMVPPRVLPPPLLLLPLPSLPLHLLLLLPVSCLSLPCCGCPCCARACCLLPLLPLALRSLCLLHLCLLHLCLLPLLLRLRSLLCLCPCCCACACCLLLQLLPSSRTASRRIWTGVRSTSHCQHQGCSRSTQQTHTPKAAGKAVWTSASTAPLGATLWASVTPVVATVPIRNPHSSSCSKP